MNKFKHFTKEELNQFLEYEFWEDNGVGKLLPPLDVACNVLNDALDKHLVQRTKKHIFTLDELCASEHACRHWLDLVISENNPGVKLSLALTGAKPLSLVMTEFRVCYVIRNGEQILIDQCSDYLFDKPIYSLDDCDKDRISDLLLPYARHIKEINQKFGEV